jgi:hypothetical protein
MELVEGEDLATRLQRGPLTVGEAIAIARHVAAALDAAHTSGIVHRDLKPANVKVRPDGMVKVLDFGLAKAGVTTTNDLRNSPTITGPVHHRPGHGGPGVTEIGMILGTAAYMSPEQARGRPVDKRTDIWAFGCLLYELLAGRPTFDGETVTDVLGSIVKTEPDWSRLPADTPPAVLRLLRRCLHKDPEKRLRDIGDAIFELDATGGETPSSASAAPGGATPPAPGRRARLVAMGVASAIAIAALAAAAGYRARPSPVAQVQKFHLAIQTDGGAIRDPVISPDGRHVAYIGRSRIWVQSLDQWSPRELPGTEEAMKPFWSPAGDWLAYFRSENLFKIPVNGGPVVRIATLPSVQSTFAAASGVWREDGTIVISLTAGLSPMQVPSGGGDLATFGELGEGIVDLHGLSLLPGGDVLAAVHRKTGIDAIGIVTHSGIRIIHTASNLDAPAYAPSGHVIYERAAPNAGLWAVPFSLDRLETTGEAFLVGEGVNPSVARAGTVAFLGQPDSLVRQLSWITMDGQLGARLAEPREWTEGLAIAPDGRRVLAATTDGIWAYDVDTGTRNRITTGTTDITPAWIGANAIVFIRTDNNEPVLMLKQLAGGGEERVLARRARFPQASADGRRISFNIQQDKTAGWQVGWIDFDQPSEIQRLGGIHLGARFPSISPDGRLVAYISGEVGRDEVFLTTLPSGEGKWQVSTEGGGWTRITPRGDAIVFRAPDASFMSVPLSVTGGEVKLGQPRKLFDWGAGWHLFYDVSRDGRAVVAVPLASRTGVVGSLSIVQNWHLEFAGR